MSSGSGSVALRHGFQLATWFQRLAAHLIDRMVACGAIITGAFGTTIALFDRFYDPGAADPVIPPDTWGVDLTGEWGWWLTAGAGAVLFVYAMWFLLALRNAQTPGKQLVGIRVVRVNGEPSSWGYTFVREFIIQWLVLGILTTATLGLFYVLDYLWPLQDKDNQALHDKMAGTLVVEARTAPAKPAASTAADAPDPHDGQEEP